MSDKFTRYTVKIPSDLANFFQNHIEEHKELGFRFVSQYILHVLQEEAKKLLSEKKALEKKEKVITLTSGTYSKDDIKKLLENIEE